MIYLLKSLRTQFPKISIAVYILIFIFFTLLTGLLLPRRAPEKLAFCPEKSTWRHASYIAHRDLSYVKSIEKVLQSNFCGIEIDIIWNPLGFFYVAHDPYPESELIPDDIKLDHVMKELGAKKIHWWLDWKNPEFGNIIPASSALDTMARNHIPSSSYFFVESARLFSLSAFSVIASDRIRPVFWITKSYWSNLPGALANMRSIGTLLFQPKYVSMNDYDIVRSWQYLFPRNNLFLFTENEPTAIRDMFSKNYSVILTDLNEPVLP